MLCKNLANSSFFWISNFFKVFTNFLINVQYYQIYKNKFFREYCFYIFQTVNSVYGPLDKENKVSKSCKNATNTDVNEHLTTDKWILNKQRNSYSIK